MSDSPFLSDFRALLTKHGITHPRFAHSAATFNPDKPQVLYSGPVYDQEELVAGVGVLVEGRWSVAGEYVHRFEREFSKYLNQAESVMVNSGSSSDLLMIAACKARFGWKDGDGVIVSPCGFPTTISAITLNGLTPVFVDIEWNTLNADNQAIEQRLQVPSFDEWQRATMGDFDYRHEGYDTLVRSWHQTDQSKWTRYGPIIRAIFCSPVLGNPPDIDQLVQLATKYGVKLLMDGCDSLGTTWRGKHLAEYATATTCSFFPSHHISTLQGGMISSNDPELIRIARQMSSWGRACYCCGPANLLPNGSCGCRFSNWLPSCPDLNLDHKYIYETAVAYNLQPLDIQGALGLEQLKKVESIHMGRKEASRRIKRLLFDYLWRSDSKAWTVSQLEETDPSWFGVPVICPTAEYKTKLVAHLEAAGIQTRNPFAGNILLHPGYQHLGNAADYPNATETLKRVFFVGCHPMLTEAHFAHIGATLKAFKP